MKVKGKIDAIYKALNEFRLGNLKSVIFAQHIDTGEMYIVFRDTEEMYGVTVEDDALHVRKIESIDKKKVKRVLRISGGD